MKFYNSLKLSQKVLFVIFAMPVLIFYPIYLLIKLIITKLVTANKIGLNKKHVNVISVITTLIFAFLFISIISLVQTNENYENFNNYIEVGSYKEAMKIVKSSEVMKEDEKIVSIIINVFDKQINDSSKQYSNIEAIIDEFDSLGLYRSSDLIESYRKKISSYKEKGIYEIVLLGFNEVSAESMLDTIALLDIGEFENYTSSAESFESDGNGNTLKLISTTEFDMIFTFDSEGIVSRVVGIDGDIVMYDNYQIQEFANWNKYSESELISYCEEVVLSVLKSPSTAKFPGGFFSGYEGWATGFSGEDFIIQSYVDSENSFGATIRVYFQVTLRLDEFNVPEVVHFIFDDSVILDKM